MAVSTATGENEEEHTSPDKSRECVSTEFTGELAKFHWISI